MRIKIINGGIGYHHEVTLAFVERSKVIFRTALNAGYLP